MHAILFGLGLLATAMGAAMIGYGIPINEFSLGNTLIIAGTVSATGGLVLIGLAAAVRQLRRIAEAMAGHPMAQPAEQPAELPLAGTARAAPAPAARIPFPPKPATPAAKPDAAPRLSGSPPPKVDAGEGESPVPNSTAQISAPVPKNGEPPMMNESEEVTLSPLPPRAPAPLVNAKPSDILAGVRPRHINGGATVADPRTEPTTWRAPSEEQPQQPNFDALWPVDARSAKAARPTPRPAAGEPSPVALEEQTVAQPQPAPVSSAQPAAAPAPAEAASAAVPHAAAILKSGVVDGMAYTLYADGSIEAQLPQGTVRFGSIAELRNHIEQNS